MDMVALIPDGNFPKLGGEGFWGSHHKDCGILCLYIYICISLYIYIFIHVPLFREPLN